MATAALFPDVPATSWEPVRPFLDAQGDVPVTVGGVLVLTGDRVVLVDAGLGPEFVAGAPFLDGLRRHGYSPEAITDVVFTHLHYDHVGWACTDGSPTFPNATYRCAADDWRYFVDQERDDPAERMSRRKVGGIEDRLEPWDRDATLFPGVDVVLAPGHTPGSSIVILSTPTERVVLLGDVAHCPAQLLHTDWSVIDEVDPEMAKATRARLAIELDDPTTHVAGAHFPELSFGRVATSESGRRQWTFRSP